MSDIDIDLSPEVIEVSVSPQILLNVDLSAPVSYLPNGQLYATAGASISAGRVVVLVGGLAYHADPTNILHAGAVIGVAVTSAVAGEALRVMHDGEATSLAGLVASSKYHVGLAGVLTTTPTAVGAVWQQYIGVAKSTSALIVQLESSIELT